jgi:biotin transport system substrate-specific component
MIVIQESSTKVNSSSKDIFFSILQIIGASAFIALCAQIRISLYFSPVPVTGQTFAIMLIGASLGSRKGVLSVLLYLLEGAMGLPVFAGGLGLISLFGVKSGYFLGFIAQVYLVGRFTEKQKSFQNARTLFILLFSCLIQMGLGVIWLSSFVGIQTALFIGLYPFLIGETIKSVCIAAYLKSKS